MITVDQLRANYPKWTIHTQMAIGVAAWRNVWVLYKGNAANILLAGNLDELASKLADQEVYK
jgi:hypothetical protein